MMEPRPLKKSSLLEQGKTDMTCTSCSAGVCGFTSDADHVGALNILARFCEESGSKIRVETPRVAKAGGQT